MPKWSIDPPATPGTYEVRCRPLSSIALADVAHSAMSHRIAVVRVDDIYGRFDAGDFAGWVRPPTGEEPWWEWRGPIEIPDGVPSE